MTTRRTPRSRLVLAALATLAVGGCAPAVVLENPATRQQVNCTLEARRLTTATVPSDSTGLDVPRPQVVSPGLVRFDYEQQCRGNLEREGFVCVSGC